MEHLERKSRKFNIRKRLTYDNYGYALQSIILKIYSEEWMRKHLR